LVTILDVLIAGLLLGGIYALIAVGLSMQYGVARVLNIAHGEFIMLGAFITWTVYTYLGINPIASPGPYRAGHIRNSAFLLYRTVFTRLRRISPTPEPPLRAAPCWPVSACCSSFRTWP
jgi:branched-chain amino acid transport system permease protein